ncbi:MAG TPA: hypothetical protein VNS57_01450, partial [Steroidobacteraceae bacterium]|nr:hypothetical protein [Steroidobacteraceae bacterium]
HRLPCFFEAVAAALMASLTFCIRLCTALQMAVRRTRKAGWHDCAAPLAPGWWVRAAQSRSVRTQSPDVRK